MSDDNEKQLYTTGEIAEELDVTTAAVRKWITQGRLQAIKLRGRWVVTRDIYEPFRDEYEKWSRTEKCENGPGGNPAR